MQKEKKQVNFKPKPICATKSWLVTSLIWPELLDCREACDLEDIVAGTRTVFGVFSSSLFTGNYEEYRIN